MAKGMSWEEAAGFGEGDLLPVRLDEVLDGKVVPDLHDIRWKQWWDSDRMTTHFKLEVDDTWYRRTPREEWEELNRLALGLVELQRRTGVRPEPRPERG